MSKISELSDGGALQSTDYLIAVRSGGNVKVQPAGMTFSSATLTTVDINGGTIDGVTTGGSSPGAATFTTLTATTADINGGTIDGADITVGSGKTFDVSAGTFTLANDQISGDSIEGGTIGSVTITSLTATSADINGGTIDGVTLGGSSQVTITDADMNGGTIDGVPIGATTPAAGTFTTTTTDAAILDAISETIADTAVDVFVYDTSRDSDGGAWRHRTQHTSWYNETLNTATRGSRREFPAVAVIVLTSGKATIYDGDDPSLPMWMTFDDTYGDLLSQNSNQDAVFAINGVLVFVGAGMQYANFISDSGGAYQSTGQADYLGNLSERSALKGFTSFSGVGIVNNNINDVAMTVLPNAPIDAATGLPVPTIAVATDGGYSQIGWDGVSTGNVWDAVSTAPGSKKWSRLRFTASNQVVANLGYDGNANYGSVVVFDVLTADVSYAGNSLDDTTSQTFSIFEVYNGVAQPVQIDNYASGTLRDAAVSAIGNALAVGTTERDALALIERNPDAPETGMHALVTSTYNTGYMPASIKLATLSDTDDTDVTGSELVTNGTFDTDTDWTLGTGATISGGTLSYAGGGSNTQSYQTLSGSAVGGSTYVITYEVSGRSAGILTFKVGNTNTETISENGSFSHTVVAASNSAYLYIQPNGNFDGSIDNVSIRLAELDRSVNGNGLGVYGTITKTYVDEV